MSQHPFETIEPKWQAIWEDMNLHTTDFNDNVKKIYCLVMFSDKVNRLFSVLKF